MSSYVQLSRRGAEFTQLIAKPHICKEPALPLINMPRALFGPTRIDASAVSALDCVLTNGAYTLPLSALRAIGSRSAMPVTTCDDIGAVPAVTLSVAHWVLPPPYKRPTWADVESLFGKTPTNVRYLIGPGPWYPDQSGLGGRGQRQDRITRYGRRKDAEAIRCGVACNRHVGWICPS
jgi:hypothetical protein